MTNGEFPLSSNFYVPTRVNNIEAMYEVTIQYNTIQYNVLYFERVDIHD